MDLGLSDLQAAAAYRDSGGLVAEARLLVDRPFHLQTSMDIRYNHGSLIHCLRASHSQDAPNLLAVGGEHTVAILQVVSRF